MYSNTFDIFRSLNKISKENRRDPEHRYINTPFDGCIFWYTWILGYGNLRNGVRFDRIRRIAMI